MHCFNGFRSMHANLDRTTLFPIVLSRKTVPSQSAGNKCLFNIFPSLCKAQAMSCCATKKKVSSDFHWQNRKESYSVLSLFSALLSNILIMVDITRTYTYLSILSSSQKTSDRCDFFLFFIPLTVVVVVKEISHNFLMARGPKTKPTSAPPHHGIDAKRRCF